MTRRRVQLLGALLVSAFLPYFIRLMLTPGSAGDPPAVNTLAGNAVAVFIAFWVRLSVEPFPGVRSSSLNLPVASASHAAVVVGIVLLRLPYDRSFLLAGYVVHLLWLYAIYFFTQRRADLVIAIVPYGDHRGLTEIETIDWRVMQRPSFDELDGCEAIVADFGADMPREWEAFLADAAVQGRVVYQVKQLFESLTGRVEIEHLSENSFGSLMPASGYFHFKELLDFAVAILLLPFLLPVIAIVSVAIMIDGKGPVFSGKSALVIGGDCFAW